MSNHSILEIRKQPEKSQSRMKQGLKRDRSEMVGRCQSCAAAEGPEFVPLQLVAALLRLRGPAVSSPSWQWLMGNQNQIRLS